MEEVEFCYGVVDVVFGGSRLWFHVKVEIVDISDTKYLGRAKRPTVRHGPL